MTALDYETDAQSKAYRVIHGVIFIKGSSDPSSGVIIQKPWLPGSLIHTTGRTWTGHKGAIWAETFNSKPAPWVLVQGPGFGFQGPLLVDADKVTFVEIRGEGRPDVIAKYAMSDAAVVSELIGRLASETNLDPTKIRLTKGFPEMIPNDRIRRLGFDYTKPADILDPTRTIGESCIFDTLNLVYLGNYKNDIPPWSLYRTKELDAEPRELSDPPPPPPPPKSISEAEPTGKTAHFEVVHHPHLVLRTAPSTAACTLGAVPSRRVICGTPYKFSDDPWLRLDAQQCKSVFAEAEEAWVLIHGGCLGLGQLLRKLSTEEEEGQVQRKVAAAESVGQKEQAAGPEGAVSMAAGVPDQSEASGGVEGYFQVVYSSVAVRAEADTSAMSLGGLVRGKVVFGAIHTVQDKLWLRLGSEECLRAVYINMDHAWVLIDGASIGVGMLLRRLSPAEEAAVIEERANQTNGIMDLLQRKERKEDTRDKQVADEGGKDEGPLSKPMTTWSVDDVVEFVTLLQLGHLESGFRQNGVDGDMLASLTEAELVDDLGLSRLQARKVIHRLPR